MLLTAQPLTHDALDALGAVVALASECADLVRRHVGPRPVVIADAARELVLSRPGDVVVIERFLDLAVVRDDDVVLLVSSGR